MKFFRQMKVKMKIGYSALQAGQTVLDFFINGIVKAYVEHTIPNNNGAFILDDNIYFKWKRAFRGEIDQPTDIPEV